MTSRVLEQRMIGQLLGVGLVVILAACSGRLPAAAPAVTANGFFEQAALASGAVRTGEEQNLHLILRNGGGSETIFQATITYANGVEQQVLKATTARETTLAWNIPPDAGVGRATFRLTTTGCGCGDRSVLQVTAVLEGSAEGAFQVQ